MTIESNTCSPEFRKNGELSGFDTVDCKPYSAKLSQRACAMRYAKAKGFDIKRYKGMMLRFQALEEAQLNSLQCLSCSEGESNYARYGKAKGRNKNIVSAKARVKIYMALRNGQYSDRKKHKLFGFTVKELRKHIENQFKPGMTWENYGEWQVDHIIPVSAFHYESTTDPGFRQCWSLANLQPLWRDANVKKDRKIESPL